MSANEMWLPEQSIPKGEVASFVAGCLRTAPEFGYITLYCAMELKMTILQLHNGLHFAIYPGTALRVAQTAADKCTNLQLIRAPDSINAQGTTINFIVIGYTAAVSKICENLLEAILCEISQSTVRVNGSSAEITQQQIDQ